MTKGERIAAVIDDVIMADNWGDRRRIIMTRLAEEIDRALLTEPEPPTLRQYAVACGCVIVLSPKPTAVQHSINFCCLHSNAAKMLAMLTRVTTNNYEGYRSEAEALVRAAEGRK